MPLRPAKWLMANQFQHARSFLGPSLAHESVPESLRGRVEFRIRTGKKLLAARVALVILLFVGVGAFVGLVDHFRDILSPFAVFLLGALTLLVPLIAAPGILVITRSIRLLETDLYILAAEVVARCRAAGGPLPSEHWVHLGRPQASSAKGGPTRSDRDAPARGRKGPPRRAARTGTDTNAKDRAP